MRKKNFQRKKAAVKRKCDDVGKLDKKKQNKIGCVSKVKLS
jgi:hypothetical protein